MQEHRLGHVARLPNQSLIKGDDVAERYPRLHEFDHLIEYLHADCKSSRQLRRNFSETSGLNDLRNVATVFRFQLRVDHIACPELAVRGDATGPWNPIAGAPVGHRGIIAAI